MLYIHPKNYPNVGKYSIHGASGYGNSLLFGGKSPFLMGKQPHTELENHHVEWEKTLFLWQCSMAMLHYQRVQWGYLLEYVEEWNGPLWNMIGMSTVCSATK